MKRFFFYGALQMGVLAWILVGPEIRAQEPAVDATTFVRTLYKHGIPYAEAQKYTEKDVPALLKVLENPADEQYWANVVITLGIIGDQSVTQPLIHFLEERFDGEVNLYQFNALISVPLALGHAALRGNQAALDYLKRTHTIPAWQSTELPWSFQKYRGETRSIIMSKMSIRGFAFSGKDEARELLVRMRDSGDQAYVQLRQHATNNITEALQFHERLSRAGPLATFVYRVPTAPIHGGGEHLQKPPATNEVPKLPPP